MGETLLDIAKLVEGYGGEACKAGSEGVGPDASGARKLKLAYEISVRGAWTVGGCDIKPLATLFGSTGDAWWCRTRGGAQLERKHEGGEQG